MSASGLASAPLLSKVPNRRWILKRRPVGMFDPKRDVELLVIDDDDEKTEQRGAEDHQVIVEPEVLSVDAFLRTVCDAEAYHGALKLGDTFPAIGYGTVVWAGPKSGHKVGTRVSGMLEAADRAVLDGKTLFRTVKLPFLDHTASLGLLSLVCGMTAYAGIFYVPSRAPRRGETVVVTAAAGAVGSVAVQLAKSTGARVVGIAGGPAKNEYMRTTLNCDAVIDYKDRKTSSLEDKIAEACPNGIDFVFDNVGGETLDALLGAINPKARVVICGAISQYSGNLNSKEKSVRGPSNYIKLAERGAEMRGYNVMQHFSKLPFMLFGLYYLWARGKVHMTEHIEDGLERFPHALRGLFTGENIGKTMVRIRKEA
eukprot:CAMPEP_0197174098 /NCGR_PEP_ID=MMETSP1423-20130617/770_1 /TAXON_ID=476441 /ORGANISM="Pseudo-nitzschia heimii, Strain UNC1101" /LENGTH=369 /DNA_ID=CAMNT_0042622995 /DNA_START=190 /DNA_END=1299 /DNA_ORIENTATION=+